MFKKVNDLDVMEALNELIIKNGSTTALDVKKKLRKDGFWAMQNNISKILGNVYDSMDIERYHNGLYFIYRFHEDLTLDSDCDSDDETINDEDYITADSVVPTKTVKSKIISEPELIFDDTIGLRIVHEGVMKEIIVSSDGNIENIGEVVYKVRTPEVWYVYSSDPSFVTRHKAIYYVWKALSATIDSKLKYADIRSSKYSG